MSHTDQEVRYGTVGDILSILFLKPILLILQYLSILFARCHATTAATMSSDEKKVVLDPDMEKDMPAPLADAIRAGSIDQKILEHSHDADEAMKAFIGREGTVIELDEATNKRLLRRIDWNLMPIMCVVYGLNYLDKTTISYASIMGIKTDIGLVNDDYQWLGSMFYFGYLGEYYAVYHTTVSQLTTIPSMGIPNQPSPAAAAPGQVLRNQHHALGRHFELLRRREQLLRRDRCTLFPRCLRIGCDTRFRFIHKPMVY